MSPSPTGFPVPADEDERLQDLASYDIHGSAPEADYDHLARLAGAARWPCSASTSPASRR
jgi:hypothetical protein